MTGQELTMARQEARPARWLSPSWVVPAFVAVAMLGAFVPRLIGYPPYGQEAVDRQMDRDEELLCAKFGFADGTPQARDCKAELAKLRRRQEQLVLY